MAVHEHDHGFNRFTVQEIQLLNASDIDVKLTAFEDVIDRARINFRSVSYKSLSGKKLFKFHLF